MPFTESRPGCLADKLELDEETENGDLRPSHSSAPCAARAPEKTGSTFRNDTLGKAAEIPLANLQRDLTIPEKPATARRLKKLGTGLLYHVIGNLSIDSLIAAKSDITGPIGKAAVLLVLSCLVIELKPFPANGWGLDVYETAPSGIAAMISFGVSAGVSFSLVKLPPLFEDQLAILAVSGGLTFLFSNLIGLKQSNIQRLLGYSAIGVHVWLPGAYSEADDDFTAMLSGVASKLAVFGLLMGTYLATRSGFGLELAHSMAWLGMLTTIAGALMALWQTDLKCLLALSSMSQLGYIITATALVRHLGWVTALYLVANHMMVKGTLFLAIAGIILRTGTRSFAETGGLVRTMPVTFVTVLIAIIAMSGLPPLMGFGGKWLLLSAMMDKEWHFLAIAGIFAALLCFLYMIRLVGGVFLGPPRRNRAAAGEAPAALLVPQFVLIVGIVIRSLYPKLLMEPV